MKPFFVTAITLIMLATSTSQAAGPSVDFSAYVRSGVQLGAGFGKSEALWTGFAKHNRLQEGQYFELSAKTNLPHSSHLMLTLGNGGESFHYNSQWPGPGFAVRNLYFAMENLPDAPKLSLWAGSRMYRGSDIYLFDNWPLDNQNILGFGFRYDGPIPVEFALATKNESSVVVLGKSSGKFDPEGAQRFILINKLEVPLAQNRKIKTNFEFHVIPSAMVSYRHDSGTTYKFEALPSRGVAFGFQLPVIGSHTVFANYGYGNVLGAITPMPGLLGTVTNKDGTEFTSADLGTATGSEAFDIGLSNSFEAEQLRMGLMYAIAAQTTKAKYGMRSSAMTAAIRPMHYLTDFLHVGIELDATGYFEETPANVSYGQISPMIEYALNKNVYGSPKFRLIASQAFYAREVVRYGQPTRQAFALGLGFEVWF